MYHFPVSACPYTNWQIRGLFSGPGSSKMCMKSRNTAVHTQGPSHLLHNKPAAFAQRASHLLYSGASSAAQQAHSLYKTRLLFCPGSASAATAAASHAAQSSCRAARPAGRTRELKGERTGMYFYRNQASLIYEWCNICIRSMDITPCSSHSRI